MTEQIFINGIDAETGQYLVPPIERSATLDLIKGVDQDSRVVNWLRRMWTIISQPHLGLPLDVRPEVMAEAGWAIVFHRDEDEAVKQAFAPLIEHRKRQVLAHRQANAGVGVPSPVPATPEPIPAGGAGGNGAGDAPVGEVDIVKVLTYQGDEGDDANRWLARHDVSAGNVVPHKVPYYLLIVGSPARIPFLFSQNLDVEYAVGRLHFDQVAEYSRYVQQVIDYETGGSVANAKEAVFWGTRHDFDRATQLSADWLVKPLAEGLPAVNGQPAMPGVATKWGYHTRQLWGGAATKAALRQVFAPTGAADTPPPAFLFTASHGMGWSRPDDKQPEAQGALVCQDWPGFGGINADHYFAASDLVQNGAHVPGLIAFFFACYGAGTPLHDRFMHKAGEAPPLIAQAPFIAALPKALLAHGGALACIGHVERAWGYSIQPPKLESPQLLPFQNAIGRILIGQPIGHALKDFNERYAALSSQLADRLERIGFGQTVDEVTLAADWIERNDAQGYAVIGDPAVRLRASELQPVAE